jgi:hypothetical protein
MVNHWFTSGPSEKLKFCLTADSFDLNHGPKTPKTDLRLTIGLPSGEKASFRKFAQKYLIWNQRIIILIPDQNILFGFQIEPQRYK